MTAPKKSALPPTGRSQTNAATGFEDLKKELAKTKRDVPVYKAILQDRKP
jgi:hypothetical protein